MNPMTNMKNVKKLSEEALQGKYKTSWHDQYKGSAWIFVGGLPYDLTEGDLLCVFSQYGEIVNVNLVRDKDTGKSKGFSFICYEDQRSTNLAVDNFNGIKLLTRTIRVDHVEDYKAPKDSKKIDEETRQLYEEGCAPGSKYGDVPKLPSSTNGGLAKAPAGGSPMLLPPLENLIGEQSGKSSDTVKIKKEKKEKKDEKKSKSKKLKSSKNKIQQIFKKKKHSSSSDSSSDSDEESSSDSDSETSTRKRKKIQKKKKRKEHSSSSDESGNDRGNSETRKSLQSEKKMRREKVSESTSDDERGCRQLRRPGEELKRYEQGYMKREGENRKDPQNQKSSFRENKRQDDDRIYGGRDRDAEKESNKERDRARDRYVGQERDRPRYADPSSRKPGKIMKNSGSEWDRRDFRDNRADMWESKGTRVEGGQRRDGDYRENRRDSYQVRSAR